MSDLLYKPGDIVVISSDLKEGEYPVLFGACKGRTLYCNTEMEQQAGRTFKIKMVEKQGGGYAYYRLDGVSWVWTESMFESAKDDECFCMSLL